MSPQDQLADAPEGLLRIARWLDSMDAKVNPTSPSAGANQADLRRWADAIEAERHTPAVEAWKFVLGVSLGMVAAFLWGWIAAGGQL